MDPLLNFDGLDGSTVDGSTGFVASAPGWKSNGFGPGGGQGDDSTVGTVKVPPPPVDGSTGLVPTGSVSAPGWKSSGFGPGGGQGDDSTVGNTGPVSISLFFLAVVESQIYYLLVSDRRSFPSSLLSQ